MLAVVKSSFSKLPNSRALAALTRSFSANTNNVQIAINDKTGIATVTMQKAPVNSLNKEFITQLNKVVDDLEKDNCKGMILTSAMKVFSAGLNFNEFQSSPEDLREFVNALIKTVLKLYETSIPTVSLINGHAAAGGCLLALLSQYRISLKNSKIGYNETEFGLFLPACYISMFEKIVGAREAELALCLGKMYTSEEALRVGLVDEVVEDVNEGLERAEKFLLKFQRVDAKAASITKAFCRERVAEEIKRNAEKEADFFVKHISDPEVQSVILRYVKSLKTPKI